MGEMEELFKAGLGIKLKSKEGRDLVRKALREADAEAQSTELLPCGHPVTAAQDVPDFSRGHTNETRRKCKWCDDLARISGRLQGVHIEFLVRLGKSLHLDIRPGVHLEQVQRYVATSVKSVHSSGQRYRADIERLEAILRFTGCPEPLVIGRRDIGETSDPTTKDEMAIRQWVYQVTRPGGVDLIAKERARQISEEGWSAEHDDEHTGGELALAGACYALPEGRRRYEQRTTAMMGDFIDRGDAVWQAPEDWPWDEFKPVPDDRERELVKAGALIAAEIDRLLRTKKAIVAELIGEDRPSIRVVDEDRTQDGEDREDT